MHLLDSFRNESRDSEMVTTVNEEINSSVIVFEYLKIVRVIKNSTSIIIARLMPALD